MRGVGNTGKAAPAPDSCFYLDECLGNAWPFFLLHLSISLGFLNHVDNGKFRRFLLLAVGEACFRSFRCHVTPEVVSKLQKWFIHVEK